jgi:hypothetical protein
MPITFASSFWVPIVIFIVMGGKSLMGGCPAGHAAILWSTAPSNALWVTETATVLSEFEGRYKVGHTTCTVKPIKMAFEVRWATRKRVMRFFYDHTTPDGKAVFVSEDTGQGTDKFVFDDNRYNAGTFFTADGRIFAVERVR